ncbi:hypothetical protein ANN_24320 [Periplaneta americana]|uniref:Histone-lysine N-methyltransferase SETMAR n=1 Tax=Periplaneta americana TaxID=6978 RepID=A0ABQ8S329_PERAM|nr:hypothetical protein ANN_24320 [Periplaneta americana]
MASAQFKIVRLKRCRHNHISLLRILVYYHKREFSLLLRKIKLSQCQTVPVFGRNGNSLTRYGSTPISSLVETHLNAIDLARDRIRNLGHRRPALYQLANQVDSSCEMRTVNMVQRSARPMSLENSIFLHFHRGVLHMCQRSCLASTAFILKSTYRYVRKGVLLIEFLPRGETINRETYCQTLKKLRRAIQNKRRGMLTDGVVLLHDNARPHTARNTQNLISKFGWEQIDHPPYSPDMAPSDFHFFLHLKKFLGGQRFDGDDEVKTAVREWFASQAGEFYNEGIERLVPRLDKCLNNGGDYVEK